MNELSYDEKVVLEFALRRFITARKKEIKDYGECFDSHFLSILNNDAEVADGLLERLVK